MSQTRLVIRAKTQDDLAWISPLMEDQWGGEPIHVRGFTRSTLALPGLVAEIDGQVAGLLQYDRRGHNCEIVTLNALTPAQGSGTSLVSELARFSAVNGLARLTVTTTNDNLDALRFYQRRGFRLATLRCGAVDRARSVKPAIPRQGAHGIPLRDELDLVRCL